MCTYVSCFLIHAFYKICTFSGPSHFSFSNLLNWFLVNVMYGVLFVLPLSCAVTLYINESQHRVSRQDMNFSSRLFKIYVNLSLERRPRAGRRNKMFYISANLKNLHICTLHYILYQHLYNPCHIVFRLHIFELDFM